MFVLDTDVSLRHHVETSSEAPTDSYEVGIPGNLSLRVKWLEREADPFTSI
jgi:hypothetical protein